MPLQSYSGTNHLVRSVAKLVQQTGTKTLANDFGTLLPDRSLRVDGFSSPFLPGMFLVAERLLADEIITTSNPTTPVVHASPQVSVGDHGLHDHGLHDHGPHTHTIPRTGIMRPLQPGDRVLIGWANPNLPVVVDRLNVIDAVIDPARLT